MMPVDLTPEGDSTILTDVVVNRYATLAEDGVFGSNQIKLAATTPVTELQLQPNDLLLIWQTQGVLMETRDTAAYGTPLAFAGTGRFELIGVSSVDAANNTVTLYPFCGGLRNTYAAGQTQVVRVPQYNSLLIGSKATLHGKPWDGRSGGVIALRVQNTLTVDGKIDAAVLGFGGGPLTMNKVARTLDPGLFYRTYNPLGGGIKGESVAGDPNSYEMVGKYGRGAAVNGGGGGNTMLAGGGGGANGDNGVAWSGQGVMSGAPMAWMRDPGYVANNNRYTNSSGGGRGGYTYSTASENPLVVAPEDPRWLGDLRREHGGLGGRGVPNDPRSRVYLGGGGGAGDNYLSAGGAGAPGGGLVLLIAGSVVGNGTISADGGKSGDLPDFTSGAGGGGGGGTVVVAAGELGPLTLSAVGGGGGSIRPQPTVNSAAGPGGGGGGGFVALPQNRSTSVVATVIGGSAGTSSSPALAAFPQNGATAGAAGVVTTLDNKIYGGLPFCSGADLGVTLKASPTTTTGRSPTSYVLTVTNQGPSAATNLAVSLRLPDSAEIEQAQGDGWTCTTSAASVVCQRPSLLATASVSLTVTALPPLSVTAALATAQVSASSVDANLADNLAESSLDITEPRYPRALGGGLSCQLGSRPTPGWAAWAALLTVPLLLARRRRVGRQRTFRNERAA